MDTLTRIAPVATWLRVSAAAVLLLAAFTVLSHALVHVQAYGRPWSGPAPARLVRTGSALLLLGILLWGWDLGWSGAVLGGLAVTAAAALALEARARTR